MTDKTCGTCAKWRADYLDDSQEDIGRCLHDQSTPMRFDEACNFYLGVSDFDKLAKVARNMYTEYDSIFCCVKQDGLGYFSISPNEFKQRLVECGIEV